MAFQRDIKFCFDPSIPDSAIVPEGVSIHRQDRTTNSGKSKGGGVCCMVNNLWCSDVEIISLYCSPDLEHLMIRCRPYYIPREFTSVVVTAVYIPPHANTNQALDKLHAVINRTESSRPKAAFIVASDFNNAKMRKVLPRYHQHISCPTRGANTLDHVYTPFRDVYKALPRPPFGKSDHVSVLLLPAYRQNLKRHRPVTRTIQRGNDQSDSALRDCFRSSATSANASMTSYPGLMYDHSQTRSPGLMVTSMQNSKHGLLPISQVIWRSTGSPGTHSGVLLAVPRDFTGTRWSLTTRAPTQGTCGLD